MRTLATVLPLAMVLAAFSAAETASGLDGKCGVPAGVPVEEPLVALDGVITARTVRIAPASGCSTGRIACPLSVRRIHSAGTCSSRSGPIGHTSARTTRSR